MTEYILDLTAFDGETLDDGLREEIVRCKDCKYAPFLKYGNNECVMHLQKTKPDNFCAWGKRKEGVES